MNDDLFRMFKAAWERKQKAKKELVEAETLVKDLSDSVLDEFSELGIDSVKIEGKSIFVHNRPIFGIADGHDKDDLLEALKENGFDDYVSESYNAKSLPSIFNNMNNNGELPEEIAEIIVLDKVTTVRMKG